MRYIIIPLTRMIDYYCLPGHFNLGGPARDGWSGSSYRTNCDPEFDGTWTDNSQGFGVSIDEVAGQARVYLPDTYTDATGAWSINMAGGLSGGDDPRRPYSYWSGTATDPIIHCDCKAVVTPFPKPQTGSDYNLELSLAPGDCAGPLSNIVWTPSPNSGQGSDKATYNGLKRDTCYDFTVTGTDTDGCGADVDLSFQLPAVGVGEPPCGGRGGLGGGSGGSFGGHGFGSGGFGGTGAGGGIF